MNMYIIDL